MRQDVIKAGPDHPALLEMFRAEGVEFDDPVSMMWREVDGDLVGGFAWSHYTGDTIQVHIVGVPGRWMNREITRRSFTYPFLQLRVKVILAFLPENRVAAHKVALGMGFKQSGFIPGVNVNMLTLVRQDCERWLALPSRGSNG
jgi:hypothetical protein